MTTYLERDKVVLWDRIPGIMPFSPESGREIRPEDIASDTSENNRGVTSFRNLGQNAERFLKMFPKKDTREMTRLLVIAVIAAGLSGKLDTQEQVQAQEPNYSEDQFTAFLPALGNSGQFEEAVPLGPIDRTSTPTTAPPTETPTPTEEPSPTPTEIVETERIIPFAPTTKIWRGLADPYKDHGSILSEGASTKLRITGENTGWVSGTDGKVFQAVDSESGDLIQLLRPELQAQLTELDEEMPPADQEVEALEENIEHVIADNLRLHGDESGSDGGGSKASSTAEHLRRDNIFKMLDGAEDVGVEGADEVLSSKVGLEVVSYPGMRNLHLIGLGLESAYEIPPNSSFTATFSLSGETNAVSIGRSYQKNGEEGFVAISIYYLDQELYVIDVNRVNNDAQIITRKFNMPFSEQAEGKLTFSPSLDAIENLTVKDDDGIEHTVDGFDLIEQWPQDDRYIEFGNATKLDQRSDDDARTSGTLTYPADVSRAVQLVDNDPNAVRKARLTDRSENLAAILNSEIAIPIVSGRHTAEYNLADAEEMYRHGNHLFWQSAVTERVAEYPSPEDRSIEYFSLNDGATNLQPFNMPRINKILQARRNNGTNARLISVLDLRDTTILGLTRRLDDTPDEVRARLRSRYVGYDSNIHTDALQMFGPSGLTETVIKKALQSSTSQPQKTGENWAEMTSGMVDGEYFGTPLMDPQMPLGITQTDNIIRFLDGANSHEKIHIPGVIFPLIEEPDMVRLQSFITNMNNNGYFVSLSNADRHIPIMQARELLHSQPTDNHEHKMLVLFDPSQSPVAAQREYNKDTVLFEEDNRLISFGNGYFNLTESFQ